jgi:hypothetical protein
MKSHQSHQSPQLVTDELHSKRNLDIIYFQRDTKLAHFFVVRCIERVAV